MAGTMRLGRAILIGRDLLLEVILLYLLWRGRISGGVATIDAPHNIGTKECVICCYHGEKFVIGSVVIIVVGSGMPLLYANQNHIVRLSQLGSASCEPSISTNPTRPLCVEARRCIPSF
jgi:hypothetical protein